MLGNNYLPKELFSKKWHFESDYKFLSLTFFTDDTFNNFDSRKFLNGNLFGSTFVLRFIVSEIIELVLSEQQVLQVVCNFQRSRVFLKTHFAIDSSSIFFFANFQQSKL